MLEPAVIDGNAEIDGGSAEEIRQELQAETVDRRGHGTAAADAPAETGEGDADGAGNAAASSGAGKKRKPADRIGALTGNWRAEQRRALALERERDDLRQELEAARKGERAPAEERRAAAPETRFGGVALTEEKYPSYAERLQKDPNLELEDYSDQRSDWRAAKAQEATAYESANQERSQTFEAQATAFAERMAGTIEADPKFYDSIDPMLLETPAASIFPANHKARRAFYPIIVDWIQKSEAPAEMLAWLSADGSKNLQRLKTLQPGEAYRAFLRQELSIRPDAAGTGSASAQRDEPDDDEGGEEPPARRSRTSETGSVSRAAAPVRPVRGSAQQAVETDPSDDDTDDEFYRKENAKQLAAYRKARNRT